MVERNNNTGRSTNPNRSNRTPFRTGSTNTNRSAGPARNTTPNRSNGPNKGGPNRSSSPRRSGGSYNNRRSGGTARNETSGQKVMRRGRMSRPSKRAQAPSNVTVPPIGDNIRIIPLGGVEEVGKNCTAIEVGDDIIVIDAGFQFKDETTPGIDYILPNTKYLEERKDRIKGLFITHGHLDHIGAIPYILDKIGNPPIYVRQFGAIMIQKRHSEFPHLKQPDIRVLDGDETTVINENMKIESFAISHTIPDSMGLVIHTHLGDIVFIEDVRVDNVDGKPSAEEVKQYKRFKKDQNVLLLTMDSTSIEKPGWSLSENVVIENMKTIIKEAPGRLFIGTFASQVERIMAVISISDKYGKKVVIEGRSMKSNLEIVKQLNLMKADNIIPMTEMENVPADKLVFLVTGSQGEEFAVLNRVANNAHKQLKFKETDTILLSSSIIPTNHTPVTKLKDNLYRSKARVITYLDSDVHASGHGNREELAWIHEQINYKFFVPLHGQHFMLRQHAEMAQKLGAPVENTVVPDNGSIIEISDGGNKIGILPMKAPSEVVTVDGFSVSNVQDVVLHDRQLLSESGIFVIVASINTRTGKLKKSPDIISRGFVYLRESQDLLHEARNIIKKSIEKQIQGQSQIDFEKVKKNVSEEMSKFLFQKTAKEPLVIPVILGV